MGILDNEIAGFAIKRRITAALRNRALVDPALIGEVDLEADFALFTLGERAGRIVARAKSLLLVSELAPVAAATNIAEAEASTIIRNIAISHIAVSD